MSRRYRDWLLQAQQDLKAARDSLNTGHYEWTAFQARQGAEKALKALLRYHNHEARSHTLIHLLETAQDLVTVPSELWLKARELDCHYIQPCYPNGFATGYPAEFYDRETAESVGVTQLEPTFRTSQGFPGSFGLHMVSKAITPHIWGEARKFHTAYAPYVAARLSQLRNSQVLAYGAEILKFVQSHLA